MKKILMLVLFISYVNAETVGLQDAVRDGMINGVTGLFKELTGQNEQLHEENCQKEYKKLYERNSKLLKKEKEENIMLRRIAEANNIKYEKIERRIRFGCEFALYQKSRLKPYSFQPNR